MHVQLLFGIGVAFGFIAWGVVTALYVWPELRPDRASRRLGRCLSFMDSVPLLLITHGLVFRILLQPDREPA